MARGGATLAERMATAEAQIEAIHEAWTDRDREIKALKEVNADINRKLDLLIADKERRDGVLGGTVTFKDGPPATTFELNGWGDDLVHDYLKGIEIDGRLGVLYSNKDYGCEWDYDWRNKRFLAEDNTKFGVNVVIYALTT